MSVTEMKATIAKMSRRQKLAIREFVLGLDLSPARGTPAWRTAVTAKLDRMQAGDALSLDEIRLLLSHKGGRR